MTRQIFYLILIAGIILMANPACAAILTYGPSIPGPAIPDAIDLSGANPGAAVSTTITIPGGNDYVINPGNAVTITITGLNHTFMNDLEFILSGPVGAPALMLNNPNGSCDFSAANTYTFNSGSSAMPGCSVLPSGNYAAESGFSSSWTGVNINNTQWTLSIQDFYEFDTGAAGWQWSISFDASPAVGNVPEPATLGTAFAGLALAFAAWRRRKV
jgi:hypothetical protein